MVLESTGVKSLEAPEDGQPFDVNLSGREDYERDAWLERGTMDLFDSINSADFLWEKVVCLDTAGFLEPENRNAVADGLRALGFNVTFEGDFRDDTMSS